jgi:small subunit ribosomal protein S20
MPNTKSAAKAMRQSARRRGYNLKTKEKVRTAVKSLTKNITAGKRDDSLTGLKAAMSALDKAAKKGVIHKNTASRKKSRLAKAIAKLAK